MVSKAFPLPQRIYSYIAALAAARTYNTPLVHTCTTLLWPLCFHFRSIALLLYKIINGHHTISLAIITLQNKLTIIENCFIFLDRRPVTRIIIVSRYFIRWTRARAHEQNDDHVSMSNCACVQHRNDLPRTVLHHSRKDYSSGPPESHINIWTWSWVREKTQTSTETRQYVTYRVAFTITRQNI